MTANESAELPDRMTGVQLVEWIRDGRLRPVLHGTFRLSRIHRAEEYFVDRGSDYLGKIVIVPDAQWEAHGSPFSIE